MGVSGKMRETRRVKFPTQRGHELVGILERPTGPVRFQAVAAHCFTCTKDLKTLVKLSRELVRRGIAVFRFDFTGLGESQGDFSTSTFADNCEDLEAALRFVETEFAPVDLLFGHSLGGATSLVAAARRQRVAQSEHPAPRVLVTLGSPCDTPHLADKLERMDPTLLTADEGEVTIGGINFVIRRPMLDGLRSFDVAQEIQGLDIPTLIVHSRSDTTVDFANALSLFDMLRPHASLLAVPDADHLFTTPPSEIAFLAETLDRFTARATSRYLAPTT